MLERTRTVKARSPQVVHIRGRRVANDGSFCAPLRHHPQTPRPNGRPTRAALAPPRPLGEAGAARAYPPHPQLTLGNPMREACGFESTRGEPTVLGARSVRRQRTVT